MNNLKKFDFDNLFILDMANNHQGSIDHGIKIIESCANVVTEKQVRAAIKFQFRNLPNFVHCSERTIKKTKHTDRFLSTMLSWDDFQNLRACVASKGMLAICTPFDEFSVEKIVQMKFDVIKVASCSAKDWPLLEAIANTGLPVIASTGGLLLEDIDNLVSFFRHRACDFALMHCVSVYPTPDELCNLGNISDFRRRYPGISIGWSTHENPIETTHVGLALAVGASLFERHVGIETQGVKLNAYSSGPENIARWLDAHAKAKKILGTFKRGAPSEIEKQSITELSRGVYVKSDIFEGELLTQDKVYFAYPCAENQLTAGEWKDGAMVLGSLNKNDAITKSLVKIPINHDFNILKNAIHEIKAILAYAGVPLNVNFTTEYSHHYGIENFRKCGVVLINVINRSYAKKILVQLPNQSHPLHYHKLKEETFIVIWGKLVSVLDGVERILYPGDSLTVPPGVWHKFSSLEEGCVFEEISTTAYSNDSVYKDPFINNLTSAERKTQVDHWGRFQLDIKLNEKRKNLDES